MDVSLTIQRKASCQEQGLPIHGRRQLKAENSAVHLSHIKANDASPSSPERHAHDRPKIIGGLGHNGHQVAEEKMPLLSTRHSNLFERMLCVTRETQLMVTCSLLRSGPRTRKCYVRRTLATGCWAKSGGAARTLGGGRCTGRVSSSKSQPGRVASDAGVRLYGLPVSGTSLPLHWRQVALQS